MIVAEAKLGAHNMPSLLIPRIGFVRCPPVGHHRAGRSEGRMSPAVILNARPHDADTITGIDKTR